MDEALGAEGKELTVSFCNARFALQGNGTDLNPAPAMGAEWVPEALEIVTAKVRTDPRPILTLVLAPSRPWPSLAAIPRSRRRRRNF